MDEDPIVPEEAIIPNEELDLDLELDDTDDVEALKAQIEQEKTAKAQILARAKKAEAELALTKKPKPATTQSTQQPSVEETVLLANGMDEQLIEKLKTVAKVQGVGLIKAQNDPIFVAIKSQFEKESKQKEASLPVSRGSGQSKPRVGLDTPNLPRDDHKRLAMEAMNG